MDDSEDYYQYICDKMNNLSLIEKCEYISNFLEKYKSNLSLKKLSTKLKPDFTLDYVRQISLIYASYVG